MRQDWQKVYKQRTETEIKFDVYQNYLVYFKTFIEEKYNNPEELISFLLNQINLKKSAHSIKKDIIKKFLYIGWNTEFLSRINDKREIELLRINNQWKPIQSYYAIYSIGEALNYLINGSAGISHKQCLKNLNNFLVKKITEAEPWSFACEGVEKSEAPSNFPIDVKLISSLQRWGNLKPVDVIYGCLHAEHCNLIREWKPPRLSEKAKQAGQKRSFKKDYDPGYTTILDFLYRLRIKSNYKDVEIFITGASDDKIKGFSENLSFLVFYTLILFEILIIKQYDEEEFLKLANDYLNNYCEKSNNNKISAQGNPLSERVKLYKEILRPQRRH